VGLPSGTIGHGRKDLDITSRPVLRHSTTSWVKRGRQSSHRHYRVEGLSPFYVLLYVAAI
jgi:hypothetical protein